jgi:hypothetical protein
MLANLDYSVVGSDEVQILECKTAGEYGAKLWRDGVPLYVSGATSTGSDRQKGSAYLCADLWS